MEMYCFQYIHTLYPEIYATVAVVLYIHISLQAGAGRWGTDEAELNAILCLRSHSQLLETIKQFEKLTGTTMEDSIRSECSGTLQEGYLAIGQYMLID